MVGSEDLVSYSTAVGTLLLASVHVVVDDDDWTENRRHFIDDDDRQCAIAPGAEVPGVAGHQPASQPPSALLFAVKCLRTGGSVDDG
ncbi:unnamed protein product [Nippostrongylus brasiliensis]|uniref:Uncharacterized protein n=1 Tax=Nippostrongylus brasiliensis TaxID=27835 RepID=A0A0N4YMN6_NIPBR|nr:unnamed protein product [Nippostrongylus brasiliensis]